MTAPDDPRRPHQWAPPDAEARVFAGYGPPPMPGPEREPLAVAAFIVGLAALVLFFFVLPAFLLGFGAFVVGTSALLRLRRRPDRSGRAMAGIGVAAGVLSIILAVVLLSATDDDTFFEPMTVPYAELNVGDCYQGPSELDTEIEVVSCGFEHDRQAVGAVEHPAPAHAPNPGEAVLLRFADERCQDAFSRFVNTPEERAGLVALNLVPTGAIWDDGSRHIVCGVARRDGASLVGSVTDSSLELLPSSEKGPPG